MIHEATIWLLVAAFLGAGLVNAASTRATREGFIRWGYPSWWGRVTGGLEVLAAALIAWPLTRTAGLVLGAAIIVAAAATVLRHRAWAHMAPISAFLVLLAVAVFA